MRTLLTLCLLFIGVSLFSQLNGPGLRPVKPVGGIEGWLQAQYTFNSSPEGNFETENIFGFLNKKMGDNFGIGVLGVYYPEDRWFEVLFMPNYSIGNLQIAAGVGATSERKIRFAGQAYFESSSIEALMYYEMSPGDVYSKDGFGTAYIFHKSPRLTRKMNLTLGGGIFYQVQNCFGPGVFVRFEDLDLTFYIAGGFNLERSFGHDRQDSGGGAISLLYAPVPKR